MSEEQAECPAAQRSDCRHARNPGSPSPAAESLAGDRPRSCSRRLRGQKPRLPWHAHASTCAPRKSGPPDQALPAWDRCEERTPREDGDVKILSLLDHPSANERHKMLAANKASNAANIGIVADQVCAIAGAPDGALDESGHGLAMAPENLASPLDEQQSVVHGVNTTPGIHLVAANHHVGVGLGCSVAQAFGVFTGNQQSLIVELNANRNPVL